MKDQLDSLIPIFLDDDSTDKIDHIGTGVFIYFRGFHFILTAAHILDELKNGLLSIPVGDNSIRQIEGSYSKYGAEKDRKDDLIDVGYYKLAPLFAESLLPNFAPVLEKDMHFTQQFPENAMFSISGYPYRKSKLINHRAENSLFSFGSLHASEEEYKKFNCFGKPQILATYNRKKTINPYTKEVNISVLPHGVSGGGFFIWPKTYNELPPKNRTLAGIAHTYKAKEKLFIGTNIIFVLELIIRNNPHLRFVVD